MEKEVGHYLVGIRRRSGYGQFTPERTGHGSIRGQCEPV